MFQHLTHDQGGGRRFRLEGEKIGRNQRWFWKITEKAAVILAIDYNCSN
jgi:hypothetical protein